MKWIWAKLLLINNYIFIFFIMPLLKVKQPWTYYHTPLIVVLLKTFLNCLRFFDFIAWNSHPWFCHSQKKEKKRNFFNFKCGFQHGILILIMLFNFSIISNFTKKKNGGTSSILYVHWILGCNIDVDSFSIYILEGIQLQEVMISHNIKELLSS